MYIEHMRKPPTRQKPGEFIGFNLQMHPDLQRAAKAKAHALGVTKSAYLAELVARDTGHSDRELPIKDLDQRTT